MSNHDILRIEQLKEWKDSEKLFQFVRCAFITVSFFQRTCNLYVIWDLTCPQALSFSLTHSYRNWKSMKRDSSFSADSVYMDTEKASTLFFQNFCHPWSLSSSSLLFVYSISSSIKFFLYLLFRCILGSLLHLFDHRRYPCLFPWSWYWTVSKHHQERILFASYFNPFKFHSSDTFKMEESQFGNLFVRSLKELDLVQLSFASSWLVSFLWLSFL